MGELCYVLKSSQEGCCDEVTYHLPDGRPITLDCERCQVPEALFDPTMVGGDESSGIHRMIRAAIFECFSDQSDHRDLVRCVVLAGGNTVFPGIDARLHSELKALIQISLWSHVKILQHNHESLVPQRVSICGAKKIADIPTLSWMTRENYKEHG